MSENKKDPLAAELEKVLEKARAAQKGYLSMDQGQIDAIVKAMALAGIDHHVALARMAHEET